MRRAILLLLICLALCAPVRAEGAADELYDALDIGQAEAAVPQEARDIMGDAGVEDAMEPEGMLSRLADAALEKLGSLWRSAAASGLKLVAVALLCALASAFTDGGTERYVGLAGCLAVSAVAFTDAGSCVGAGVAALEDLQTFSRRAAAKPDGCRRGGRGRDERRGQIRGYGPFHGHTHDRRAESPAAPGLRLPRGAHGLGGPRQSGHRRGLKAHKQAHGHSDNSHYDGLHRLAGHNRGRDGRGGRCDSPRGQNRHLGALPVVGGVISDAASTVVAGAGLLKNAVGAFGLIAAASVCLAPFLALGLRYLCYKAAAALAAAFADKRVSGLISELGGVFGMVLGVVGASALMLFISIISVTKAVSG